MLSLMDSSTPLEVNEALSGIFGTISLVTWTFLTVPQLLLNYRTGSAEGLSLAFLMIWVLGDLANFIGGVWAQLVPTVIALACWFTIADSTLLLQCLYYNYIHHKFASKATMESDATETEALLGQQSIEQQEAVSSPYQRQPTWTSNLLSIIFIIVGGFIIWVIFYFAGIWIPTPAPGDAGDPKDLALPAEILGYLSATCYLGARLPQIWKNYRGKSCEGLSLLFFILSLQGNLTYGLSILCHSLNKRYLLTNLPWLLGSLGTMVEDMTIFAQFRTYGRSDHSDRGSVGDEH